MLHRKQRLLVRGSQLSPLQVVRCMKLPDWFGLKPMSLDWHPLSSFKTAMRDDTQHLRKLSDDRPVDNSNCSESHEQSYQPEPDGFTRMKLWIKLSPNHLSPCQVVLHKLGNVTRMDVTVPDFFRQYQYHRTTSTLPQTARGFDIDAAKTTRLKQGEHLLCALLVASLVLTNYYRSWHWLSVEVSTITDNSNAGPRAKRFSNSSTEPLAIKPY